VHLKIARMYRTIICIGRAKDVIEGF